ncbi:hypothetical protein SELMODRAFT_121896 [Selaginella moellendorffii]|uniref:DNA mismatch repair protein S5 domain-containing protein n=1 Tax=Selaginella moellendorffii TaxID=88036 RepID=D8SPD6_SELML|nr:hypothetical protein SELMODRAFT_121896 [Selaginella moellendorffii]
MASCPARSAPIHPIDKASIHRICSGQVILDLATAVKELVENSLDAGATSIEVKLKEHGGDAIEVSDNGSGVSSDNYQVFFLSLDLFGLTLKYHTSKLSDFSDLQSLTSFGFRGEALSSLCSLADVSILTRTKEDETGTRISYNRAGLIVSKETAARQVGTTVTVSKLFSPLPVRHKEFLRNVRREYSRMIAILQAYALISKNVRLVCTNLVGKSSRSTILRTQGGSVRENIVTIFGPKTMACLDPMDISLPEDLSIEGFVSKPGSGSGRGSSDRQFFFVNGRPVDLPKFSKLLNELYKSFNSQQYPMAVLNFRLPTTAYDVNVTPDKRKLFLHSESSFMDGLRNALGNLYAPSKYTYAVHEVEEQKSYMADLQTQVDIEAGVEEVEASEEEQNEDEDDEAEPEASKPLDFFAFSHEDVSIKTSVRPARVALADKKCSVQGKLTGFVSQKRRTEDSKELLSEEPVLKRRATTMELKTPPNAFPKEKNFETARQADHSSNPQNGSATDGEALGEECGGLLSEAPLLKKCAKIIGQFNLGFIIARLDSDLFIIDQHASDEKYNFERLSKSTVLNRQPLLRPMPLHLSSAEEIIISTHMEVFRQNGFDFTEQEDAPPGQRILLSAVPFSKNVTFGVSDVQELVSLLSEDYGSSSSHLVQPSRVRSMLASRACRSSIMIGDALSKKEMEKVVRHLADLDAPWNCPHGRPTMRHLYDLNAKKKALLSP